MRKLLIIFLLIIMLFTVIGCSPNITKGEVYQKEHNEAWTQFMMMPITISNGKTSTTTFVPMIIYHPENWIIYIRQWNEKDRKYDTEDFYLNSDVYDRITIGEWFEFKENMGTDEEQTIEKEQ